MLTLTKKPRKPQKPKVKLGHLPSANLLPPSAKESVLLRRVIQVGCLGLVTATVAVVGAFGAVQVLGVAENGALASVRSDGDLITAQQSELGEVNDLFIQSQNLKTVIEANQSSEVDWAGVIAAFDAGLGGGGTLEGFEVKTDSSDTGEGSGTTSTGGSAPAEACQSPVGLVVTAQLSTTQMSELANFRDALLSQETFSCVTLGAIAPSAGGGFGVTASVALSEQALMQTVARAADGSGE